MKDVFFQNLEFGFVFDVEKSTYRLELVKSQKFPKMFYY